MFKVLRQKLTKDGENGIFQGSKKTPPGVNKIEKELQKRYANGVNYNMKIVIRGDRNVGKTALFNRLQGKNFDNNYIATDEIQVTNIEWNYKNTDHIVKVEVWDVIDEGKKRKVVSEEACSALKLCNNSNNSPFEGVACDASVIDVYKNTNGVIFIFDITKNWTWHYIQRELDKVDKKICVLIMANKSDLESERAVDDESCKYYLNELNRSNILFTSSSMKTAYGLRYLHAFFNVPFLNLQKDVLEKSLKQNQRERELAFKELEYFYNKNKNEQASEDENFTEDNKEIYDTISINNIESSLKQKEIQSSDDDGSAGNKMVDMYEDDFDSEDDFNQSLKISAALKSKKDMGISCNIKSSLDNKYKNSKIDIKEFGNENDFNSWIEEESLFNNTNQIDNSLNIESSDSQKNSSLSSPICIGSDNSGNNIIEMEKHKNNISSKMVQPSIDDIKNEIVVSNSKPKKIKKSKNKKNENNDKINKKKSKEKINEIYNNKQKDLLSEDYSYEKSGDISGEYYPI